MDEKTIKMGDIKDGLAVYIVPYGYGVVVGRIVPDYIRVLFPDCGTRDINEAVFIKWANYA